MNRIGIGYDSHMFCEGRALIIGGVKIGYNKGLKGHSDGDVLLHAIADALLGACGLGDIGSYFPDTDDSIKGIDSSIIIKEIHKRIKESGFQIINIDCVILAEEPKLGCYYGKMINNISEMLEISRDKISIKAKTNEGMGFIGRKEGIASYAIALLEYSEKER